MDKIIRQFCELFREVMLSGSNNVTELILSLSDSKLIEGRVYWYSVGLDLYVCIDMDGYDARIMPQIDNNLDKYPQVDIFTIEMVIQELKNVVGQMMSSIKISKKSIFDDETHVNTLFALVRDILNSPFYQVILKEFGGYVEGSVFIWHIKKENLFAVIDPEHFSADILDEPHDPTSVDTTMVGDVALVVIEQIVSAIKANVPPIGPPLNKIYQGKFSTS